MFCESLCTCTNNIYSLSLSHKKTKKILHTEKSKCGKKDLKRLNVKKNSSTNNLYCGKV